MFFCITESRFYALTFYLKRASLPILSDSPFNVFTFERLERAKLEKSVPPSFQCPGSPQVIC